MTQPSKGAPESGAVSRPDGVRGDDSVSTYPLRDGESAAEAVVRAVSAETGIAPTDLPPLYSFVDSDALDELFTSADGDGRRHSVSFDYFGYRVQYGDGGEVTVEKRE